MDEGTKAPTEVAYLTGYSGTEVPEIAGFSDGNNDYLGLNFKNNGSVTTLNFELEQDFENPNQKTYSISLNTFDVTANVTALINVKIQNIFDNPPNVLQLTNPCSVDVSENNL